MYEIRSKVEQNYLTKRYRFTTRKAGIKRLNSTWLFKIQDIVWLVVSEDKVCQWGNIKLFIVKGMGL